MWIANSKENAPILAPFLFGTLERLLLPFGLHHMLTIPINYTQLGGTYEVLTGAAKGTKVLGQEPLWLAWVTDLANLKGAHPYQYRHLLEAYTPARFKVGQMIGSFGILMGMVVAIYRNVDDDKNWIGDPAFWNRHAPVLFPFVGKVNGGFYTHKGVKYPMGQHGFARDNEFECIENTENKTVHRLVSTEETQKVYPFDFAFTVTQELSGRTLTITWNVENTGDDDMYFSVGGHPAFMIPEQYDIVFNKGLENHTETELEYVLIDPETAGVDAAHPRKLKLQDGRIPYTRTLFDEDALIFDNTQVERVGVEVDGKPYVTLTCKGFPSVGVWSKPKADAPFVCLEPWIGRCDNVGFDGELKDKYGEQHLKAGETFQAGYTITIGE